MTGSQRPSLTDLAQIEKSLSNEVIHEIGLLFVTAAQAEFALALHMGRLLAHPAKIDPAIMLAISGAGIQVRLQQIQILARMRLKPEAAPDVVKQCDQIGDSFDQRNDFAHFVCVPGQTPDKVALKTIKLKKNGTLVPEKTFTASQIREIASTLMERVRQLDELLTGAGIVRVL